MLAEFKSTLLEQEADLLIHRLKQGDRCASLNLARLIQADTHGVFEPFAEALAARLQDHLARWAELGETDPEITLEDEVYQLLKVTAIDWDGRPCSGRPGEEA